MNNKILKINLDNLHNSFLSLALTVSLLIFGIAYVYLISTSIFLANARRVAEEKSAQLESELAMLETNYLEAQTSIDLSLALEHGFVEPPKDSTFAYRIAPTSQETSLSMSR